MKSRKRRVARIEDMTRDEILAALEWMRKNWKPTIPENRVIPLDSSQSPIANRSRRRRRLA